MGSAASPATAMLVDAGGLRLPARIFRRLCMVMMLAGAAGCGREAPPAGTAMRGERGADQGHHAGLEAGFVRRFAAIYVEAAGPAAGALSPTRFVRATGIAPADPPWSTPMPDHLRQGIDPPPAVAALEAVHAQMQAAALDPDDLTDVATYHAALAWLIVQQRKLDPARLAAIRAQVRPALLDRLDGEADLADATLQRMADALALEAAQLGHAFSTLERRGDRAGMVALGVALRQRYLVDAGIDLGR